VTPARRKLLIVDDDEAIRSELESALGGNPKLEIATATDGQVALHQIATGQFWPDVILLDLMMPRLDGEEFLATLDAINRTEKIAVIVMTALRPSDVSAAVRRRAHSILFKPFTLEQFAGAVRAAVPA
jgi:CheY-like chemotaxis protein